MVLADQARVRKSRNPSSTTQATVLPDEDDNNQSDSDNNDNDNDNENDNVQYSNRSTSVNGGPALTKMTSKSVTIGGTNQTELRYFPFS